LAYLSKKKKKLNRKRNEKETENAGWSDKRN